MLAQIGLSPDALVDMSATKGGVFATRLAWDALAEALQSHGTLLLASEAEMARFIEILKGVDLTVDEKKRLTAILTKLKKENRIDTAKVPLEAPLSQIASPQALDALKSAVPLVVVLPDGTFARLVPQNADGVVEVSDDAEASVGHTFSQAGVVKKMKERASLQNYPNGTPRERIWRELFAPLAARFPRVTVCDRYLMTELVNRETRGTSAQYRDPEHLTWLLDRLDATSPKGTRLVLYTQLDNPKFDKDGPLTADDVLDMIDRHWSPAADGRLETIEVYGVPWRAKLHPHNRHIRFGESLGFKLDEGLDRLALPTVTYKSGFSYVYAWRGEHLRNMREDEGLVKNSPDVSFAEWNLKD